MDEPHIHRRIPVVETVSTALLESVLESRTILGSVARLFLGEVLP